MKRERELAKEKMEVFLESGFSTLLIGERGIGKSQIYGKDAVKVNCAAFADDNTLEAELLGVGKGVFTGVKPRDGALKKADNGKLFLDEVHHLSKAVQARLMVVFGTDSENKMKYCRLGTFEPIIEVQCKLIFATNKTIDELKEILLPDFYDRIVQNVIEIPPLRETKDDREQDWASVWKHMKFVDKPNAPKDEALKVWLKDLPLYGNYRDLEKIAIYYNGFEKLKNMILEKTAFEYAKNQFKKWKSPEPKIEENNIIIKLNLVKNSDEIHKDLNFELQKWAIEHYGSKKEAAKKLGVEERTLTNWNKRSKL